MTNRSSRKSTVVVLLLILIALAALFARCSCQEEVPQAPVTNSVTTAPPSPAEPKAAESAPTAAAPIEKLTPATVTVPNRVTAGARFSVAWTGPDNTGDYVTIVLGQSPASTYGDYQETAQGAVLELTAPIDAGAYEVRYVTGQSRTVLGRAVVEVVPAEVTLEAADEVGLGAELSIRWVGPNNSGDYVTIVPKDAPDSEYANYTTTDKGSPLTVRAPTAAGAAEVRYVAAQGRKVLARRAVQVTMPNVTLSAPTDAVAGSTIPVTWTGPSNPGDYITVVAGGTPDGKYGNYTPTTKGSPLDLLLPVQAGSAELRYMTGQGNKVLGRRELKITAAVVSLTAPETAAPQSLVNVEWTGPNHAGDYITIVPQATPDGRYGSYTQTSTGSPLAVKAPKESGDAEIRYMSGQGDQVLARRPIQIVP